MADILNTDEVELGAQSGAQIYIVNMVNSGWLK